MTISLTFFCVLTAERTFYRETQVMIDMAGRFVPMVDCTHDDEDTHSHLSDSPLHLPASANVSSNNCALVTFSKAKGDFMRNVASFHPTPSQTRVTDDRSHMG